MDGLGSLLPLVSKLVGLPGWLVSRRADRLARELQEEAARADSNAALLVIHYRPESCLEREAAWFLHRQNPQDKRFEDVQSLYGDDGLSFQFTVRRLRR